MPNQAHADEPISLVTADIDSPRVPDGMGQNDSTRATARAALESPAARHDSITDSPSQIEGPSAGGGAQLPPRTAETVEREMQQPFDERSAELVDQDASSRTFRNRDGTYTTEVSADVERVQDAEGDWHDIDLTLGREGDRFETATALVPVSIAQSSSDMLGELTTPDDETIKFNIESKDPERSSEVTGRDDDVARFNNLLDEGIDVELEPQLRGLKSTYVLPDRDAASVPLRESLTLPTGWSVRQATGFIEVLDTKNRVRMVWSGGPSHDAANPRSKVNATMRLVGVAGRIATAAVELPTGWLESSDRVFPSRSTLNTLLPATATTRIGDLIPTFVRINPDLQELLRLRSFS